MEPFKRNIVGWFLLHRHMPIPAMPTADSAERAGAGTWLTRKMAPTVVEAGQASARAAHMEERKTIDRGAGLGC